MYQSYAIPIAILVGFGMVAAVLYYNGNQAAPVLPTSVAVPTDRPTENLEEAPTLLQTDVSVTRDAERRNVYGNADAPVTIVEFSDYECPYCARLHPTLQQLVDESNGLIQWEYRHLPLPSHQTAVDGAIVAECVGRLIGNEAFWEFSEKVFASNQRGVEFYQATAVSVGVNEAELSACVTDQSINDVVRDDYETARQLGANGTPFSVIIYADDSKRPVGGALPYADWRRLLAPVFDAE